jgi:hypothetical protein
MYVGHCSEDAVTNIKQVPVIYLVEPTAQNLQIVTSDLSRGLYSLFHHNWITLRHF